MGAEARSWGLATPFRLVTQTKLMDRDALWLLKISQAMSSKLNLLTDVETG